LALDASQTRFSVFLELTLDNFESDNPDYVRTSEGKKQYIEDKLSLFLRRAMEHEAVKQFGPLPSGSV
jgi:hypothetical protein